LMLIPKTLRYIRIPQSDAEARRVEFPIEDTSQWLANKRVHFRDIPSAQWTVIDEAQPYQRTDPPKNRALGALRNLSNRDKHRALNPLLLRTTMIQFYDATQTTQATTDFEFPHSGQHALGDQYLEIGTEVVRVGLPDEVDVEVEAAGHIAPNVQLPEWEVRFVFGVGTMIRAVQQIVDRIEPLI
jgi:hypothetical protein